jgi:hypothetical protein
MLVAGLLHNCLGLATIGLIWQSVSQKNSTRLTTSINGCHFDKIEEGTIEDSLLSSSVQE